MLKKVLCVSVIVLLCFSCLPVFSFASQNITQYAGIPRPVPSDNVKYIVTQNSDRSDGFIYMISTPSLASIDTNIIFQAVPTSYNKLSVYCFTSGVEFDLFIMCFDLNGNFVYSFVHHIGNLIDFPSPFVEFYSPYYSYFDLFDIPVHDPDNLYSWGSPSIAWNDASDPTVYTTWLNSINAKLNEIDNNTDNVEAQLSDISSQLSLFYSVFNSYQSQIIGDMFTIISSLNTLNSRLNSFAQQNHYDLEQIYSMLSQIYALLSEEPETRPPAIGNQDEVNDVLHSEAALNKDFSGDLQNQFNVAGNIFDGNSSFGFISNLFSDLLLSNASINSLIIFSLAIGLCVLILGRRLNA